MRWMRTNGFWVKPWRETRRCLPAKIMWKRPGESSIRRRRQTLRSICMSQGHGGRMKSLNEFRPLEVGITRLQSRRSRSMRSRLREMSFYIDMREMNFYIDQGISMNQAASAESTKFAVSSQPLSPEELRKMNAYWRAANYLSVGQIYLYANPLLREPLKIEHVKPRLLGHWGTTPGLNFVYAHFNRLINKYDLNVIYICGPGHGGPGMVANTYLEGTYTELYPNIQQNEEGLRRLFKQFSFPGGIPSHEAPETPGSIHEGGELGYSMAHAYGAVFDNPDLLTCCVVGDGESETGPLATSWHSNKFLNPARDGAVLPILHLNGYK